MFYMALSLAFTAGGIILLYLLWGSKPAEGQTLNAVVFGSIIETFDWGGGTSGTVALSAVLPLDGRVVLVATHTGILRGAGRRGHMAGEFLGPGQGRFLSSRLAARAG